MDSECEDPASAPERALRRQVSEVGAVCSNPARTDLCGGRRVTGVPTATNRTENALRLKCSERLFCMRGSDRQQADMYSYLSPYATINNFAPRGYFLRKEMSPLAC